MAGKLGDELVSLNEVFKARKEWAFRSEAPYVLVAPIYAWRLPKQVEAFLKRARLLGNRQIYVLATMGQSSGAAREYCKAAVEGNGMAFMGFQGIVMPDNYMVSYPMPSREEAASIIRAALPVLAQAAAAIQKGEPLPNRRHSPVGRLLSGPVNWSFTVLWPTAAPFGCQMPASSAGSVSGSALSTTLRWSREPSPLGPAVCFAWDVSTMPGPRYRL